MKKKNKPETDFTKATVLLPLALVFDPGVDLGKLRTYATLRVMAEQGGKTETHKRHKYLAVDATDEEIKNNCNFLVDLGIKRAQLMLAQTIEQTVGTKYGSHYT